MYLAINKHRVHNFGKRKLQSLKKVLGIFNMKGRGFFKLEFQRNKRVFMIGNPKAWGNFTGRFFLLLKSKACSLAALDHSLEEA